jgi:hypothetical protein
MKKLLSFFLLFGSFNLLSHEFNPAHLIIDQSDKNLSSYEATWMYPVKNIGKRADVVFPDICTPTGSDSCKGSILLKKFLLNVMSLLKEGL